MLRDDPACNGQPESGTSKGSAPGLIDAIEALEDFVLLRFGNSDAAILHGNHRVLAALFQTQLHGSGGRSVFEGVVEKNVDHTPQRGLVTQDKQFSFFDVCRELQIADGGDVAPSFHYSAQSLA